ncbi:MAG: JAB domain-containing protein [Clostridia bacterium]|nr:JAB domain-containing protein [Clostridia bacterium]
MKDLFLGVSSDPLCELFSVIYPKEKAKALSERLLKTYGSLSRLLSISESVLETEIGREAALYLRLSLSLAIRKRTERLKCGDRVTETVLAGHFSALYADATEEKVYAVFLDPEDRLLSVGRAAVGAADASAIQPRQILELAVRARADGVILTHNHPGGGLTPSASDRRVTDAISAALSSARIRFLGHYIFAGAELVCIGNGEDEAVPTVPRIQN